MPSPLFGPSRLVRQFTAWTPVETDAAGGDVAERLSRWIDPLAAIRLQAVIQSVQAADTAKPARRPRAPASDPIEDVQRVRGTLANAIAQDPLTLAGVRATDDDPGYGPWRQRHADLQRQMGQMVGALRDHLRHAANALPALRPLAVLDATFDSLLAERELALVATTSQLLERRYQQARAAHLAELKAAGQTADASAWRKAPWLAAFAQDWRQALLAELDLRLEPATGLAEALRNESGSPT